MEVAISVHGDGRDSIEVVEDEALLCREAVFSPGSGVGVFCFGEALALFGDYGVPTAGLFAEFFHFDAVLDGFAAVFVGEEAVELDEETGRGAG